MSLFNLFIMGFQVKAGAILSLESTKKFHEQRRVSMVSAFLLLHVRVEEGRLHQTCVPIKVKLNQPVIPSMATTRHCND